MATETEKRLTLRIPTVLAKRIDNEVEKRKGAERKFSMNDWLVEAVREKLDYELPMVNGGGQGREVPVGGPQQQQQQQRSPVSIPGVSKGSALFGGPVGWGAKLPKIDQEGEQDPVGALEKMRELAGTDIQLPRDWSRWGIDKKIRFMDENHPL